MVVTFVRVDVCLVAIATISIGIIVASNPADSAELSRKSPGGEGGLEDGLNAVLLVEECLRSANEQVNTRHELAWGGSSILLSDCGVKSTAREKTLVGAGDPRQRCGEGQMGVSEQVRRSSKSVRFLFNNNGNEVSMGRRQMTHLNLSGVINHLYYSVKLSDRSRERVHLTRCMIGIPLRSGTARCGRRVAENFSL
jgi:hypothetical protein